MNKACSTCGLVQTIGVEHSGANDVVWLGRRVMLELVGVMLSIHPDSIEAVAIVSAHMAEDAMMLMDEAADGAPAGWTVLHVAAEAAFTYIDGL